MASDWSNRRIGDLRVVTIHHDIGAGFRYLMLAEDVAEIPSRMDDWLRNPPTPPPGMLAMQPTHVTVEKVTSRSSCGWYYDPTQKGAVPDQGMILWASPEQEAKWRAATAAGSESAPVKSAVAKKGD